MRNTTATIWITHKAPDGLVTTCMSHDGKRYYILEQVLKAFEELNLDVPIEKGKIRPSAPEGVTGKLLVALTEKQADTLERMRMYLGAASTSAALEEFVGMLQEDNFFEGTRREKNSPVKNLVETKTETPVQENGCSQVSIDQAQREREAERMLFGGGK